MRLGRIAAGLVLGLTLASAALAEDRPYTLGSVWALTMVRVSNGQFDAYMRDLMPKVKKINEEAKKQGVLLSTHYLNGAAANGEDFDFVILTEYKNWAAFDGITEKMEAVLQKVNSSIETQNQETAKRVELRTVVGSKSLQEVLPK